MKHILIIALVALILATTPVVASPRSGYVAYNRGDFSAAFTKLQRAAQRGSLPAQYRIAVLYEKGLGVPTDTIKALTWYHQAAINGHGPAQHRLGLIYSRESEALQDFVEAYVWLSISATNGRYRNRAQARRDRNNLVDSLTPLELAKAKQRYYDQRPSRYNNGPPLRKFRPGAGRPQIKSQNQFVTTTRVAGIQRDLATLGFDPGPVDGVLGQKTRGAIRRFQAEHNLSETGRVSDRLEAALRVVRRGRVAAKPRKRQRLYKSMSGTGFFVSQNGHILTAHHVVAGCREVHVAHRGRVAHLASEPQNDLALLRFSKSPSEIATFRGGQDILTGEELIVAGFPPTRHRPAGITITDGSVNALAGPGGDSRIVWTSVPVRPGNSGGPALDTSGNVVGMMFAKLDRSKLDSSFDALPENVSFAINEATVRSFLDANGVPYETTPSNATFPKSDIVASAKQFTVLIECWD